MHDEPAITMPHRPPVAFVGRLAEFAMLVAEVEAARSVVLVGPAGVGKTRLAREVADRFAGTPGWSVLTRHATAALQHLPLGLVADLLGGTGDTGAAAGAPAGEAVSMAYRAVAEGRGERQLFVVDDASFADDASAGVLQRLIENRAASVLLTCRSGRTLPAPLLALQRADVLTTLALQPLGAGYARRLAAAAGAGQFDDAALEDICRRAGGLPLFLLALVRHRTERAGGGGAGGEALAELLPTMLGIAEPAELQALELIALGAPIELGIIEELAGEAALERLEQAGVIVVEQDRRRRTVGPAHPLLGEAALAGLGEVRRRRLLRELAAAVGKLGGRRHDRLRVALWLLDAGDRVDADAALAAARVALAGGGLTVAERLIRDTVGADASAEVAFLLAGIALEQGRATEAVELCRGAPPADDGGGQTRLAVLWAVAAFDYLGDVDEARRVIERFSAAVGEPWRFELDYFELAIRFYTGQVAAAAALAEQLLADERVPARTRAWFMQPGALALATAGRAARARAEADVLLAAVPELAGQIVGFELHTRCIRAFSCLFEGDLAGCVEDLQPRLDAATAGGDLTSAAFLGMTLGALLLHQGRLRAAVDLLDIPLELTGGWALAARAWRAQALAAGGDVLGAEAQLATLMTIAQFAFHEPSNLMAAGDVAAARGELGTAAAHYRDAAQHATVHGSHGLAAFAWLRALAVQPDDDVAGALGAAAARLDGRLGVALGQLAGGWLAGEAQTCALARRALWDLGNVLAAQQAAEVEAALVARTRPGSTAAERAAARAQRGRARLHRALRGGPTAAPSPGDTGGGPRLDAAGPHRADNAALDAGVLTAREREVVGRAAAGLRDNEIAAALGISVRTVHAHLRSAYRKLNISGRAALSGD